MALELTGLTKHFPGFTVGPLNIRVDSNILVMIGPTGSGKTSVLNLIAGMTRPDKGSIMLDGSDITDLPVETRRVGYVFQSPNLFPHLNVYENVIFGLPKRERQKGNIHVKKLLDGLGIAHLADRDVQSLSGGEMQKISLARMLAVDPKIILLDEPLAHLDPPTRRKLRLDLRRILKKQGVPVIYVTHFEEDVYALADSVAILREGKIENAGKIEEVLVSSRSSFLSQVVEGGNYVEGKVIESRNGMTVMKIGSHMLETLGEYAVGSRVGVVVRPEEIIISKDLVKTSARNIIRVQVVNMNNVNGITELQLRADSLLLRARVTEEARSDLDIKDNDYVYAIFKAISPQIVREEN